MDANGNAYVTWMDDHEFWESSRALRLRTTTLAAATAPRVTKHYYAAGQRIASRVDDELYYVLTEPTGQATLFVDDTGAEAGHIIYDAMGSVVEMSPDLPEALVSHLDSTGLQWDGLRYYDPVVGIYTQADSFGGVPDAPQSWNGYAAMPTSSPSGVFLPSNGSFYGSAFGYLSVSLNKTSGYYAGLASKRTATSILRARFAGHSANRGRWGTLSFQGSRGRFQREGLSGFFDVSKPIHQAGYGGRSLFSSRNLVEQIGEKVYRTATGQTIDLNKFGNNRWLRNVGFRAEVMPYSKLRYPLGELAPVARSVLGEALPFGIDAAWQFAADWNTDMPWEYRAGRAGVSGLVGFGAGYGTGLAVAWTWGALGLAGGPPAWLVVGAGIVVGVTVEAWTSETLNEWLFPVEGDNR